MASTSTQHTYFSDSNIPSELMLFLLLVYQLTIPTGEDIPVISQSFYLYCPLLHNNECLLYT